MRMPFLKVSIRVVQPPRKRLDVPSVRKCHESTLRVLVNLSHDNETWSSALLDNELTVPMIVRFITSSHDRIAGTTSYEEKIHVSDRLCLALGLLTNLVQVDERAKDLIRETCRSGVHCWVPTAH